MRKSNWKLWGIDFNYVLPGNIFYLIRMSRWVEQGDILIIYVIMDVIFIMAGHRHHYRILGRIIIIWLTCIFLHYSSMPSKPDVINNHPLTNRSCISYKILNEIFPHFHVPKPCFGHTYKVSAWNSYLECDFWHCVFSRDYVGELVKR